MSRRPPRSTRTDTLFPYTTLFRSGDQARALHAGRTDIADRKAIFDGARCHGWLVLLRWRAARRDQALWPGWPAARLLAARSRADPAGIDLCRLAAPERVRQPLLRNGADRAPHPHRSEERRVGKECVSTCRTRGWRDH